MDEQCIRVRDLTKFFNSRKVVDGLSLDVMKGEVFGLLGHNSLSKPNIDNSQNLEYNGERGENYVRTDEFRSLQAESQRMSDEDSHCTIQESEKLIAKYKEDFPELLGWNLDPQTASGFIASGLY